MAPFKWSKLTFIFLMIYAVLVILSSMARADQMGVTVCALGINTLLNTDH